MQESELGEVNVLLYDSSIPFIAITQLKKERIDVEERDQEADEESAIYYDSLQTVSA